MEESMNDFAAGLAERYQEECDRAYNDMIVGCCDEIARRLEEAVDDGVTGDDFSDLAHNLVEGAAEALSVCDGDVLSSIYERLSDAAPYNGAVRVDIENQRIEFVGEDNPLDATVG